MPTDDKGRDEPRASTEAVTEAVTEVVTEAVTGAAAEAVTATETETRGGLVVDEPSAGAGNDAGTADTAAASALARARAVARAKGLRPGSRPLHQRRSAGSPDNSPTGSSGSGRDGRDPALLGDQMDRLLIDRGWNVDVAVGAVMGRWPAIVGVEVATHCTPVTFSDGTLTVRADSTSWATQLRLMSSSILGRLEGEVGKGTVSELRVQGPSAPSWNHGPRKSTGPGPRDTYG